MISKLEIFFEQSLDLMAIVDGAGYFRLINSSFERILGYTKDELYSKPILEFLHPGDVEKTLHGIKSLTSGFNRPASINRYLCKNGSYRYFSWNTATRDGLFYTIGRDVTDQIIAEERIRKLNLELEKKNDDLEQKITARVAELNKSEAQVRQLQKMDAIGRLAGGIAHDFNNMLGAISMYCDLLTEEGHRPEIVQKNVHNISEATERAAKLTRQLLVFSSKQVLRFQNMNLTPLILQLEQMLTRLIGENIQIDMKLEKDLSLVSVDPSQIEQIILNLVLNARDALPQGGNITIETSNIYLDDNFTSTHLTVNSGNYVLLSVSDNGCGMSQDVLDNIFELFFTTKEPGKGTGLGLSTVYGIIKQCRGTIWVFSEPGQGSVFKIYLPVAENKDFESKGNSVSSSEDQALLIHDPVTQTILLVEDDEALRKGFTTLLSGRGYNVLVAADAKEALDFCEKHTGDIDLMLTDIIMPGINGFELGKRAAILRPKIRILYMSGYMNDKIENSGAESLSQFEFIQKPFGAKSLITKLADLFAKNINS